MSIAPANSADMNAATRAWERISTRMRRSGLRWISAAAMLGMFLHQLGSPVHAAPPPDPAAQSQHDHAAPKLAFPGVKLSDGRELRFAGEISPDGKINDSKLYRMSTRYNNEPRSARAPLNAEHAKALRSLQDREDQQVQGDVPPAVERQHAAQPIEDYQPPEHATKPAKGRTLFGSVVDSVVSVAYGAKPVFVAPNSVTTDTQNRVLVADPAGQTVQVLSQNKKKSFQIVGGKGMRLQSPAGVAVDGEGNIYISDSAQGMIFVYDSAGRFIRTMGSYGDEGIFHNPAGLAIDSRSGRLYIVDPPIHTLFIFDLKGTLLTRVEPRESGFSARKGSALPGEFQYPHTVLIHNDELFVRDATRIHVLDLDGNVHREFPVASGNSRPAAPFPGFFVDQEGRIFVADTATMTVQEYSPDGELLDAFGRPGLHPGEFSLLAGMWADPAGRIYVIDGNRIQLFQFEQP